MKKFLVSVADVRGYTQDDVLLFEGKTELDSSIETTLSNTDVRGGKGNQLQYIFYHTAELKATITESQFSLDYLALNVGSSINVGSDMYIDETITLAAGGGTVTGVPVATTAGIKYGWVTFSDGTIERVTFSGSTFTTSKTSSTDTVCVRYYNNEASARQIKITADMIPATIKLVMEATLCSSDVSTNKIGTVQIIIPKASMTGAFTLDMKPDAVSSTPLSIRALASSSTGGGCAGSQPIYAEIIEKIDGAHWYDDVVSLAVVGGDFTLANLATKQLQIKALTSSGSVITPPSTGLTFAGTTVSCTSSGLVTGATGGGTVLVTVTAKPTVELTIKVSNV